MVIAKEEHKIHVDRKWSLWECLKEIKKLKKKRGSMEKKCLKENEGLGNLDPETNLDLVRRVEFLELENRKLKSDLEGFEKKEKWMAGELDRLTGELKRLSGWIN